MKPLGEIEKEIETNFSTLFDDKISPDDLENMSATLQDLKELSSEIIEATIIGDARSLDIEFTIKSGDKNPDYLHLYLERDEDGDCWGVIA